MYLPLVLVVAVYLLRLHFRYFLPDRKRERNFLLYMLCLLSFIGLTGSIVGNTRWTHFKQIAVVAQSEILFVGKCAEDPYVEGKHRREYKKVEAVALEKADLEYIPFKSDLYGHPCVGYRFEAPAAGQMVYAAEGVNLKDFAEVPLHSSLAIRYDPGYLPNNWIDDYIIDTQRDALFWAAFFMLTLAEALITTSRLRLLNIRKKDDTP
jgi:hypothetical protein